MSIRRLKTYALIAFSIIGVLVLAVLAVFKGSKVIDYFTPEEPVEIVELNTPTLQAVRIYRTGSDPQGLVIIAADAPGQNKQDALAKALAREDIIAVTFDFDAFRRRQAAKPAETECFYVSDDLKDAGEAVQRDLQLKRYFFPVIIGIGDAAPFAYAAIAQAPKNTLAGAISIGFSNLLKTDRPYCPGAAMTLVSGTRNTGDETTYQIGNDKELPAPWYVILPSTEQARADEFQNALDKAVSVAADGEQAMTKAVIAAVQELQRQEENGVQSLPVSLIRPEGQAKALIVIISGDGGWRDIDKTIGENLAAKGIAVVGIDSLRYFWSRREPATIAADLELLLTEYGKEFKTDTYALAGYSFGANVIPFAWPLMDKSIRKKVKLVSLLGLAPKTDFEISVEGYLGSTSDTAEQVKPLLGKLPPGMTQCFYGEEEVKDEATACIFPELDKAERIMTPGGHHFDGNYDALADRIAQKLLDR